MGAYKYYLSSFLVRFCRIDDRQPTSPSDMPYGAHRFFGDGTMEYQESYIVKPYAIWKRNKKDSDKARFSQHTTHTHTHSRISIYARHRYYRPTESIAMWGSQPVYVWAVRTADSHSSAEMRNDRSCRSSSFGMNALNGRPPAGLIISSAVVSSKLHTHTDPVSHE